MPMRKAGGGIRGALTKATAGTSSGVSGNATGSTSNKAGGKIRSAIERAQSAPPAPKQTKVSKVSGPMQSAARGVAPLAKGPKKVSGVKSGSGRARAGGGVRAAAGLMKRDEDRF